MGGGKNDDEDHGIPILKKNHIKHTNPSLRIPNDP